MTTWTVTDTRTGRRIYRGGFWRSLLIGAVAATGSPQR